MRRKKKAHTRLGSVDRESQIMVLEIETNTRKVDNGLDTCSLQLLGVADTRALQDQW